MTDKPDYRWIVRVRGDSTYSEYAREVLTSGPEPWVAIQKALDRIADDNDNDLWLQRKMTVTVERVR